MGQIVPVNAKIEEITKSQLDRLHEEGKFRDGKPPRYNRANLQNYLDLPNSFGLWLPIPLHDKAVPESKRALIGVYREMMAKEAGIKDPATSICYREWSGFTLKQHARFAGPCYDNLNYLQPWQFEDTPTVDAITFWIPGLLRRSKAKTVPQMNSFLGELREKYKLPAHHLTGFGSVARLASLILAHYQRTGERVPLDGDYARTDTLTVGGNRLDLYWDGGKLDCDYWFDEGDASVDLGCLALGVEVLEHSGA